MSKKKEIKKPKEEKKVEPKKEKPKKKEEKKNLGSIGSQELKISYLGKKVVFGIEYNDVHLENGETMLLSDKDLKAQLN